ncbi:hypothetical protein D3C72_580320 [compost metagenome]
MHQHRQCQGGLLDQVQLQGGGAVRGQATGQAGGKGGFVGRLLRRRFAAAVIVAGAGAAGGAAPLLVDQAADDLHHAAVGDGQDCAAPGLVFGAPLLPALLDGGAFVVDRFQSGGMLVVRIAIVVVVLELVDPLLDLGAFLLQCLDACLLRLGEFAGSGGKAIVVVVDPVVLEVRLGLNPGPAFCADLVGGRFELVAGQLLEQGAVGQVAVAGIAEQVALDVAAGGLVGLQRDELGQLAVAHLDLALGELAAQGFRVAVP